jgi:hypothetical protein
LDEKLVTRRRKLYLQKLLLRFTNLKLDKRYGPF